MKNARQPFIWGLMLAAGLTASMLTYAQEVPERRPPTPRDNIDEMRESSRQALKNKDMKRAINILENWALIDRSREPLIQLARLYKENALWEKAVEQYTKCINMNTRDVEAYIEQGFCFLQLQELERARQNFIVAESMDSKNGDIYLGLAISYFKLAEFDKAQEAVDKGLALEPKYKDLILLKKRIPQARDQHIKDQQELIRQQKFNELKKAAQKSHLDEDYTKALKLYSQWLEEYGFNRHPIIQMARIHRKEENITAAIESYSQLITAMPGDVDALIELGYLYIQLDKIDLAEKQFQAAIDCDPNNADAYYGLGLVKYKKQDFDASLKLLNDGLKLAPDYIDMTNLKSVIENKLSGPASDVTSPLTGTISYSFGLAQEKEWDKPTRSIVIRLKERFHKTQARLKWNPHHETTLTNIESTRSEHNEFTDFDNYDIDRREWVLQHRFRMSESWHLSGHVSDGRYKNNSRKTYQFDKHHEFNTSSIAVTHKMDQATVVVDWTRDEMLIKDFSDQSLDVLFSQSYGLYAGHFFNKRTCLGEIWLRHRDFDKANSLNDVDVRGTHFLGDRHVLKSSLGYAFRQFDKDVSEYYSFDKRHRYYAILDFKYEFDPSWHWTNRYTYSYNETEEEANGRRITVTTAQEIFVRHQTFSIREHEFYSRLDKSFNENLSAYIETKQGITSQKYRSYLVQMGLSYKF